MRDLLLWLPSMLVAASLIGQWTGWMRFRVQSVLLALGMALLITVHLALVGASWVTPVLGGVFGYALYSCFLPQKKESE